ncbi:hypothetical protein ES706_06060 [subsurface metagenome]
MVYELPEDYKEYLRQNVTALERLGDAFSGVDERVNYVVRQLTQLGLTEETVNRLSAAIEELKELGIAMPMKTEQVNFQEVLPILGGVRNEKYAPFDGKIVSVMFNFPDGCYDAETGVFLVNMAFGHGSEQIFPNEGFLALNKAAPIFPVSELVKADDVLWVIMENTDGLNPHGVSISAIIVG